MGHNPAGLKSASISVSDCNFPPCALLLAGVILPAVSYSPPTHFFLFILSFLVVWVCLEFSFPFTWDFGFLGSLSDWKLARTCTTGLLFVYCGFMLFEARLWLYYCSEAVDEGRSRNNSWQVSPFSHLEVSFFLPALLSDKHKQQLVMNIKCLPQELSKKCWFKSTD